MGEMGRCDGDDLEGRAARMAALIERVDKGNVMKAGGDFSVARVMATIRLAVKTGKPLVCSSGSRSGLCRDGRGQIIGLRREMRVCTTTKTSPRWRWRTRWRLSSS